MRLETDLQRKIDNVITEGVVIDVRQNDAKMWEVKIRADEERELNWMPVCQPLIGETRIFSAPKKGMTGLIFSDGGENVVNRFMPVSVNEESALEVSEDQFLIQFKNDDQLMHDSKKGDLFIDIKNELKISAKTLNIEIEELATLIAKALDVEVSDSISAQSESIDIESSMLTSTIKERNYAGDSANYTISNIEFNGENATFAIDAEFKQQLKTVNIEQTSGTARFNGQVTVNNTISANDGLFNGKSFLRHTHGGVETGSGSTGAPQ